MGLFGSLTTSDLSPYLNSRASIRLAISEGDQVTAKEQYHDEINDGQPEIATAEYVNGNGNVSPCVPRRPL
jgi:hypothetical protein